MKALRIAAFGAALLSLAGCSTRDASVFREQRTDRHDKAGSAHVNVVSVAPWLRLRDGLQPGFKMDEDKALAEVVPNTQVLIERTLDVVERALRLAPPTSALTEERRRSSATGQADTETSTRTETEAPGDVSKVQTLKPGAARTLPAAPGEPKLDERALDPMLRYHAATALFQEVKIINQYLKYSNTRERGEWTPYLLRLQFTLLPAFRHAPYDAYVTTSVFTGKRATVPEEKDEQNKIRREARPGVQVLSHTLDEHGDQGVKGARNPVVVPLLVTDSLEGSVRSASAQSVEQTALSLLALIKGFGVGADFAQLQEQLQSVLARDLNSLFTVARVTENTVRVRLGAMHEGTARYAMVPRTHYLSLLVLVPRGSEIGRLISHSTFIDTKDGQPLKSRERDDLKKSLQSIENRYGVCFKCRLIEPHDEDRLYRMSRLVELNDFGDFLSCARDIKPEILTARFSGEKNNGISGFCDSAEVKSNDSALMPVAKDLKLDAPTYIKMTYMWSDFAATHAGSRYAKATFDLPRDPEPRLPPATQWGVLYDDTKQSTVQLREGSDLHSARITASLALKHNQSEVELRPAAIKTSEDGRSISVSFGSLKALELADSAKAGSHGKGLKLSLAAKDEKDADLCTADYNLIYQVKEEEKEKEAYISSAVTGVVADKGFGNVTLDLGKTPDGGGFVLLTTKDAEIFDPSPGGNLTLQERGWRVQTPGPVTVKLKNLNPARDAVITATHVIDTKTRKPLGSITLRVTQAPPR